MGAVTRTLAGRSLLVVGGGAEAVPGIARLRDLGAWVAVSDLDPRAAGLSAADQPLLASTYDVEATVAAARALQRERRLDGVLCIASDVPLTVAATAAALDLPGLRLEAARLATDKLAMKQALRAASVPTPDFASVGSLAELRMRVADFGLPAVLKPVDSRGARGVLRLTAGIDLAWAYRASRAHSPTGRVMIERFMDGPQISSESFLTEDGRPVTPGLADRNYEWLDRCAPFVIENGGLQPSTRRDQIAESVDGVIGRAAAALGIDRGIVKGDLVLDAERGPVVIEIAARLSGGSFCTRTIPLSTGVDLIEAAALAAVGSRVTRQRVTPRYTRPVANRYFAPTPGRLIQISGERVARRLPGVFHVELGAEPGDWILPLTDHTRRAGSVLAWGATGEQAVARAEAAIEAVHFEVDCNDQPAEAASAHASEVRDGVLSRYRIPG